MTAKKHRKSAYVPRLLVRTAIVGVVPACAIASGGGCGGAPEGSVAGLAYDASPNPPPLGVAGPAYDASVDGFGLLGVATDAYPASDIGTPLDAPRDVTFSVADAAYPPRDGSTQDANPDGGSDARPDSRIFGVAAVAYPAYEAGNG